jgi:hypothetical protein
MSDIMVTSQYIVELSKSSELINLISELGIKFSYPSGLEYQTIHSAHDTQKWLQAIKDVYYGERNGVNRSQALKKAVSGWQITEIYDFLNWLRFYQERTHLKYKVAQFFYGDADNNYLIPVKQERSLPGTPQPNGSDIDDAKDIISNELSKSQKKQIISKQRFKIISRLDSAEKLLRTDEGQFFAGKELEFLLKSIYDLKMKIQSMNKISTSTNMYVDMIIRESNILNKNGFYKAASMLTTIAEEEKTEKQKANPTLTATPSGDPSGAGKPGTPGTIPFESADATEVPAPDSTKGVPGTSNMQQGAPGTNTPSIESIAPPVPAQKPEELMPKGIAEFMKNLDGVDDNTADIEVMDSDDELIVEAQADPIAPATPIQAPIPEKPLEVKENEITAKPEESLETPAKDIDKMLSAVFSNITVNDVIAKLEDIAKFYKTREMPRQLSMVDMLLDHLKLATYFPGLAEANNKALEANNYISTRIEEVLSKLRGAVKTREIDTQDNIFHKISPEVESTREALQKQEDKEKSKKQIKKELEEQALEAATMTPEVEMPEEIAPPPIAPPTTPTVPVKPVAQQAPVPPTV